MSTPKTLAETALRCLHVVRDLPIHEKAAVLQIIGVMLQSEAKSLELPHPQSPIEVNDEHYAVPGSPVRTQ